MDFVTLKTEMYAISYKTLNQRKQPVIRLTDYVGWIIIINQLFLGYWCLGQMKDVLNDVSLFQFQRFMMDNL